MRTNFIIMNGNLMDSDDRTISRNPFDFSNVAETCLAGEKVLKAISLAAPSFDNEFTSAAKSLIKKRQEVAELATLETGAPISFSEKEVDECVHYMQRLDNLEESEGIYEPKGTILVSGTANQPLTSALNPIVAALRSGNSAILRPSNRAPSSIFELAKIVSASGLDDSIAFVPFGRQMTDLAFSLPCVNAVFWTGGSKSMMEVGPLALKYGKEFIPESEGNDWCVVDSSCDLDKASSDIFESFTTNNGQMCNSVRGAFVETGVYDELLALLQSKIEKARVGDPMDRQIEIGPLQSETQVSDIAEKILETGSETIGLRFNRNFIYPAVVKDPPLDSRLVTEGVFGPVIWLKPVDDIRKAALHYARYNKFGLSFSIFSNEKSVHDFFITRIKCGVMHINNNPVSVGMSEPWGGCKLSGFGGARNWQRKFLDTKHVIRGDCR